MSNIQKWVTSRHLSQTLLCACKCVCVCVCSSEVLLDIVIHRQISHRKLPGTDTHIYTQTSSHQASGIPLMSTGIFWVHLCVWDCVCVRTIKRCLRNVVHLLSPSNTLPPTLQSWQVIHPATMKQMHTDTIQASIELPCNLWSLHLFLSCNVTNFFPFKTTRRLYLKRSCNYTPRKLLHYSFARNRAMAASTTSRIRKMLKSCLECAPGKTSEPEQD